MRGHQFDQGRLHRQHRRLSDGDDPAAVSNAICTGTLGAVNHSVGRPFLRRQAEWPQSLLGSISASLFRSETVSQPTPLRTAILESFALLLLGGFNPSHVGPMSTGDRLQDSMPPHAASGLSMGRPTIGTSLLGPMIERLRGLYRPTC